MKFGNEHNNAVYQNANSIFAKEFFQNKKELYHHNSNSSCVQTFANQKDFDIFRWYEFGNDGT